MMTRTSWAILALGLIGCNNSGQLSDDGPVVPVIDLALPQDGADVWQPDLLDAAVPSPDLMPSVIDTDEDGVPDTTEVSDGTDPSNPASARAWHPELTEYPRLFFGPADVPALAARMTASPDGGTFPNPATTALYQRIVSSANRTLPTYGSTYDTEIVVSLGPIAESAAFLGLVKGDQSYTDKALDALAMSFPNPRLVDSSSHYDLYESEGLVGLCTAWDYLAGNPLASSARLAAAKANLIKRIDDFRYIGHSGSFFFMLTGSKNNHPMRYFGALGLCAMALNDRATAAGDISEAMTALDWLLNIYQASSSEGGYAEGFNYFEYGSTCYLPFFVAYHRWAKGATHPYYGVATLQHPSPHANQIDRIPDFALNQTTRDIYLRALWASLPNGTMPPTDDGNSVGLSGAALAWLFSYDGFLWQWFRPAVGFQSSGMTTASYALYDGRQPPMDPGVSLEGSAPEAGFAVFRESWAPDAVMMVVQGEHGNVRTHAEGHEHRDELSFHLFAYEQPLLIDPGYLGWTDHALVADATDHNTILVDGVGSPYETLPDWLGGGELTVGADATLTQMNTNGAVTSVDVTVSYEGVSFRRSISRLDGKFFAIEDLAGDTSSHNYELLLNGMAGGGVSGSVFTMNADGARWAGSKAWVDAHIIPFTGTLSLSHDLQEHTGNIMHERLKAGATMNSMAGFLTLIVPGPAGAASPTVSAVRPSNGLAAMTFESGGKRYFVASNRTSAAAQVIVGGFTRQLSPGLTLEIAQPNGTTIETHTLQ